jgi:hypothetical protein
VNLASSLMRKIPVKAQKQAYRRHCNKAAIRFYCPQQ